MEKKIIYSKNVPEPIGPYSQAVLSGNTLYCSGMIALDALTAEMVQDSIEAETRKVLENIGQLLQAADMNYNNIVKCSIFITDMKMFPRINEVYGSFFKENFPARETVQVSALPKGANIEISVVAVK